MPAMLTAQETLDQYFPEMRWRCLSLAADLDRVQRASGGFEAMRNDARLQDLHRAIRALLGDQGPRAQQVLMIFSDTTPPPAR
jgi:hypothetical protein